jgi:branched-chain amino acid transport system substrate-binding protein
MLLACGPRPRGNLPAPARTDASLVPVLAQRPSVAQSGTIPIASIFPTVGRYALSGIQSHRGARMAVEDLNRGGGIHGRKVSLLEYGTGSYFFDARHAAELAAGEGGALALIGSNSSSLSKAMAEIAEARGVVQVSNVSTAQDLTWDPATGRNRPHVFRVCGSDEVSGRLLAEFAREHLRARRAAVLYEVGRTYSASLARSFVEAFHDRDPGRVTAEFVYLPLETDFRSQLREAAAFRPDILFAPASFTDATLIAIQAERLGLHATLLGGDAWSNRLLFKRGGPSRPAYHSDHCFPAPSFQDEYRARWHEEADGCRAILAYDAVRAVAAALSVLGPLPDEDLRRGLAQTRERLRAALARVDVRGATGPIRFDARGDVRRGAAIIEVRPSAYEPRLLTWLGRERP